MDDTLIRTIIYLATAIGSNEFNNYLERLNFKEFNETFKNTEFSELEAYNTGEILSYSKILNLIPGINVIASLVHYLNRNNLMNVVTYKVKDKISYLDAIRNRCEELQRYQNGPRKYFVGFFEDDKPIVIWFTFDGIVIDVDDDVPAIFSILSDKEKVLKIVDIFNDLINGVEGYIHSENINEVLNSHLVRNLIKEYKMGKDDFNKTR